MNDLEDLLREELRARVAAAEAAEAATDDRPAVLFAELDRRFRLARLRRRWTAAALSAAAIATAVVLPLTLLSPGGGTGPPPVLPRGHRTVPLTDTAATPRGWAPVAYGDAQISVPASWYEEGSVSTACGGGASGMIFVGVPPDPHGFRQMGCGMKLSVASIVPGRSSSAGPSAGRTAAINGFRVVRMRDAHGFESILVPALHVRVLARGPLAGRVLGTLTRSPLSVVLAPGPSRPVPGGWRWHEFGGIRFAAPGDWNVERDKWWGGCPYGIAARVVRLSIARQISVPGCVPAPDTAGLDAARQGIVIGAGRYAHIGVGALQPGTRPYCVKLHGMRACAPDLRRSGALLTFSVRPPGRAKSITVELGLEGNGATARAIFDSIRPR